jgi:hypothetical protein
MKITKEIAHIYLEDKKNLSSYHRYLLNDFKIVDIYTETKRPGINAHIVIICEYIENGKKLSKHIHLNLDNFKNWIKNRREAAIEKILGKDLL